MFNILIDTCVWLDLAQDKKQSELLEPLIALQDSKKLRLIIPRLVVDEFKKNRERVAARAQRSLSTHFNLVKEAVRGVEGRKKEKEKVIEFLSDVGHRIPIVGGAAVGVLDRIEWLFDHATVSEVSDAAKIRASERALARRAPCHHENKNSIADAMIIETYRECVRTGNARERFAFVTHNRNDFSVTNGHPRAVHPDLADCFSKIRSLYCITLSDCLRRVDPAFVREVMWENSFSDEPRGLSELLDALDTLTTQVWYNRHKNREWMIERGKIRLVSRAKWETGYEKDKGFSRDHIIDSIWAGALKAARDAEKRLGRGNHGPWSDFEWGMINGKLSALRWALGDEWDMLDT